MNNLVINQSDRLTTINSKALEAIKSKTTQKRVVDFLNLATGQPFKPFFLTTLESAKKEQKDGAYTSFYYGLKKYFHNAIDSIELRKAIDTLFEQTEIKPAIKGYAIKAIPTTDEIVKACNSENYRIGLIIDFIANVGLRVSEVINIKKSDISFKGDIAYISHRVLKKKQSTKATLDISKSFIDKIYLAFDSQEYLFETNRHTPYNRVNLTKQIEKVLGYKVHSLRHYFAMSVYAESGDIKTVSSLLNHSNTTVTENYLKALDKPSYAKRFKSFSNKTI